MNSVIFFYILLVNTAYSARVVTVENVEDALDLPFQKRNEPEYICKDSPVDIVLIIDSSRSIYQMDFKKQIDFLVKFVTIFDINPTKVRVAAVSFGRQVIYQGAFSFNKYNSTKEVQGGLQRIKYRGVQYGEGTNTAMAISFVRKRINKDARPEAKKLCIVLTDGRSTDPRKTQEEAALIKQEDVQMVAIGIGKRISLEELKGIASSSDLVFTVGSHSLLETIKRKLILAICTDVVIITAEPPQKDDEIKVVTVKPLEQTHEKATTTTLAPIEYKTKQKDRVTTTVSSPSENNTKPTKKGCHGLLDINFVFNPAQVGTRRIIKFIENAVTSKALANDDVRVGTITVPFPDINGFRLDRYKNKAAIKKHFQEYGINRVSPQLADLRLEAFLSINGGRENARQIGVVFLRGRVDDAIEAIIEAKAAHAMGIEMYVISIGNANDQIIIDNIATNAKYVVYVATSNELPTLSAKFINVICAE